MDAVLETAKNMTPVVHIGGYVLRTRSGKPYTSEGFRACWQRTMAKHVKAGGERFTFHDLRAKSVSDSKTLEQAFERAGHTTMAMTRGVYDRNYRKVTPLK
jgi:integrase